MSDETNYSWTRQRLDLETWEDDGSIGGGQLVTREPTPSELLRLMDALHADMTGSKTPEYEQALSERWYYS
ncbi:hypothetical protein [Mycolicibacterium septicum]|uniref:hypothetical protein n=1 Tax=Mycolicibacterium septicum TaxID=98668 RepID=UPI001AFCB154|nr:hypothetical protein [Mycolicibacterium septicum]QRY51768.1 hypothetical protein JVX95_31080 [Mycolicibacterium septicum]